MANLSPSRIEPLSPGDQRDADDIRSRKNTKPQAAVKKSSPPSAGSIGMDADETEKHQLDERA